MRTGTVRRCSAAALLGLCVLASGCDQHAVEPLGGSSSLAVEFSSDQRKSPPEALVTIVRRVQESSAPVGGAGAGLTKGAAFTPDEARIAVLDATQWTDEEQLYWALQGELDTLYNFSAIEQGGDLWDNMVRLLRGYSGTTYRFAGEYFLPVFSGTARGVINVNPGLNMFFAALRDDKRTVYLYFSIQSISAEGDNTLLLSPFLIIQRLLDNVGSWDPATGWRAMDGGINGEVRALEFVPGQLIAGGSFTVAGSVSANNVAAYDTASRRWMPLGPGLDGPVSALAYHSNALYALSNSKPGVIPQTSGLYRWTGASWIQAGPTFSGPAHALRSDGTRLYIGGNFATAGGVTLNNIALWTDTSTVFSPLLGGTDGAVYAITSGGAGAPIMIVGGVFTSLGTVPPTPAGHLALWDTRGWAPVGGAAGISGTASVVRSVLLSPQGWLVVGGLFNRADATPVNNVAVYSGNLWQPLGGGIDGPVRTLASRDTIVYAGGQFRTAGAFEVYNIAVWNGFWWESLDSGLDGPVNAILTSGSTVFAGGSFRYSR